MAELLIEKNYEVHGIIRRSSSFNTGRIEHLYLNTLIKDMQLPHNIHLHYGDMTDGNRLSYLLNEIRPHEIYNLAAQSHVLVSFDQPVHTLDVTGMGVTRLFEAIVSAKLETRVYQASSSEMFGAESPPQSEQSKFYPRSPYGVAKLYGHWMTTNYREAHGMYAVSGILFNHESPRRGPTFVTRKISQAVARVKAGKQKTLYLGNMDAKRDWGYAPDYVVGMWRMLQQDEPRDFVLGTGTSVTVRDFLKFCSESVGLDYEEFTQFDPRYLRPTEVDHLRADPSLSQRLLGMSELVSVRELAAEMVRHDTENLVGNTNDRPIGKLWDAEVRE
mgnify:CR=1 FL=1